MEAREALEIAAKLLRRAGVEHEMKSTEDFRDYAKVVADVAKDVQPALREKYEWFPDWAATWRDLHDNFDDRVAKDPMILYRPAHHVSQEFHESKAFVRWFRAGNRTSKTQSHYAEHYLITTGQHKWRYFPAKAHATAIVGVNFSKYAYAVFQKKFISGEQNNPLSPMFPQGGKWLNRYIERRHEIILACPRCANAGVAEDCPHSKSSIRLYSDQEGWEVFQGASFMLVGLDEHVQEGFYNEGVQRTQAAGDDSCMILSGTPLHGMEAWEIQKLGRLVDLGGNENKINPDNPDSPPYVSLHEIDQFEAGLVSHERIRMSMRNMDEFEIESRIYGRPAPLAKNPVYDRHRLAAMRKKCRDGLRCVLTLTDDAILGELNNEQVDIIESADGELRIWEQPQHGALYIIPVDTAKGLTAGDASVAGVLKVTPSHKGLHIAMVAQWHGRINPLAFAEEVYKLATYYREPLVVIELTGGYGEPVALRMKHEFFYWNLYQDEGAHSQAGDPSDAGRYGIETNIRTKPMMVAALQQYISDGMIDIPCRATIGELVAFEQEMTKSGLTTRYRGAGGAHDDRAMMLAIGAMMSLSPQVAEYTMSLHQKPTNAPEYTGEWAAIHREMGTGDEEIYH